MNAHDYANITLSKLTIKKKGSSSITHPIKRVTIDRTREEWELIVRKAKHVYNRPLEIWESKQ